MSKSLPLPEPVGVIEFGPRSTMDGFSSNQVLEYAAAAVAAERERIAAWVESQRNDVPAQGAEFAAAIRAINKEV